jgi:hypothetical protein
MPLTLCPNCNRRVAHQSYDVDVEHRCNSGVNVLDNESIKVIGSFNDFPNSPDATTGNPGIPLLQGTDDKLKGTIAAVEGEHFSPVNNWGDTKTTHRIRKHFEMLELK